jgi:hypothetical protein
VLRARHSISPTAKRAYAFLLSAFTPSFLALRKSLRAFFQRERGYLHSKPLRGSPCVPRNSLNFFFVDHLSRWCLAGAKDPSTYQLTF